MTVEQIESEYLAFCASVQKDAMKIMALAATGHTEAAANAAADLAQKALTQQNQYKMQIERAGTYDLATLSVNSNVASHNETPFEDD